MGQQQLLLIIAGVIIVLIAVAVGITQFGGNNTESNKDGVTASLTTLSADAYQFKIRPSTLGGGSNSYVGYSIPSKLRTDDYGTYSVVGSTTVTQVQIQGTSATNTAWVATCTIDSAGQAIISFNGW